MLLSLLTILVTEWKLNDYILRGDDRNDRKISFDGFF